MKSHLVRAVLVSGFISSCVSTYLLYTATPILAPAPVAPDSQIKYQTFTSEALNGSFEVPQNWILDASGAQSPDYEVKHPEGMGDDVVVHGAKAGLAPTEGVNKSIADPEPYLTFVETYEARSSNCVFHERIILNGVPAELMKFSASSKDGPVTSVIITTVHGGEAYHLSLSASVVTPKEEEIMAHMIKSFRFLR